MEVVDASHQYNVISENCPFSRVFLGLVEREGVTWVTLGGLGGPSVGPDPVQLVRPGKSSTAKNDALMSLKSEPAGMLGKNNREILHTPFFARMELQYQVCVPHLSLVMVSMEF